MTGQDNRLRKVTINHDLTLAAVAFARLQK
jgi:hypothetical protein